MNINNNNLLFTEEEFTQATKLYSTYSALSKYPFTKTVITMGALTCEGLSKSVKVGYFSGMKVSEVLIFGCNFIANKSVKIANFIHDGFFQKPQKNKLINNYLIANYAIEDKQYFELTSCKKVLGVGVSVLANYLILKEAYKFHLPISKIYLGVFAFLYLDFFMYRNNNSFFETAVIDINRYLYPPTKLIDVKLNSLEEAINLLFLSIDTPDKIEKKIEFNRLFLSLEDTDKNNLRIFIKKLVEVDEFNSSLNNKKNLANRIISILFEICNNLTLREQAILRISDSIEDCHDHVLLVLSELETLVFINLVENNIDDSSSIEELRSNAKKVFLLEKIREYAMILYNQQGSIHLEGSYVEIENIFHIILAKKYNLPVSTKYLSLQRKKNTALVKEKDIDNLELYLNNAVLNEFPRYLECWSPYKKFLMKSLVIPYNQLKTVDLDKTKTICLFAQSNVDDLVYLNHYAYSFQNLKKWYIDNGTDPVNRTKMSWHDVYRVKK